jgi:hypothetical protein
LHEPVYKANKEVELDLNWVILKIHGVPFARYMGKGSEGVDKLRGEIEAENEGVNIPIAIRWMGNFSQLKGRRIDEGLQSSSAAITVKDWRLLQSLLRKGYGLPVFVEK